MLKESLLKLSWFSLKIGLDFMSKYAWFITFKDLMAAFLMLPLRALDAPAGVPAVVGDLLWDLDYDYDY